jgi:ABC-type taurine transport system substrate-binding protein
MKAAELIGEVNEKHQLQAQGPETLPPGQVRIIVLIPDEIGAAWMQGIGRE